MRYFCMVFVVLSIVTTTSYSQEKDSVKFTAAGNWGLQFQIRTNDQLLPRITSFQGNVISIKYQLSPTTGIRVGLNTNFSDQTLDIIQQTNAQEYGLVNGTIEITSQHIWYLTQYHEVYFFTGVGPVIRVERYAYKYSSEGLNNDHNRLGFGIGASGVAGVEWLGLDWLSFSVEYSSTALYLYSKEKMIQHMQIINEQTDTKSSVRFSSNEIKLGATIYF